MNHRFQSALRLLGVASVVTVLASQPSGTAAEAGAKLPSPASLLAVANNSSPTRTDALLVELRDQIRRHPSQASSWCALGDGLAQKHRDTLSTAWYPMAESAYREALRLDPAAADAMIGLAWVFGGRHDFAGSVRWACAALDLDKTNPAAHGIIGDAALELGDYDRAFECYQQMMDLQPGLSSHSRGAWLLWLTGDSRKARWLMQKAIESGAPHAENSAWCRARLAHMLFHEGALMPAAQVVEEGLLHAPDHVPLLIVLGQIHAAMQKPDAAVAAYQKVLALGSNHEALVALGDLYLAQGKPAAAEGFYQQVEDLHATNQRLGVHDHTQMARFYADHSRHLDRALELAAEHADSQNLHDADTLAWVCHQTGDFKRARRLVQVAMRQNTPDSEMIFHAGMIAAATGDTPGASKLLSRALSLNPRFHPLHAPTALRMLTEMQSGRTRGSESTAIAPLTETAGGASATPSALAPGGR